MIRSRGRAPLVLGVAIAVAAMGCATTPGPTASRTESATPLSPPSTSSSEAPPPASTVASAAASTPTPPGPSPAMPSVASPAVCPVTTQSGLLPSDRLVDLAISSTPTEDLLTFVFEPSTPGPGGPARGTLEAAQPPFSYAGSGQTFELLGQHAVQLRFSGMTLADESGTATYHGPTIAKPELTALREAIQYDASEGIVGWDVGYDGSGCVTLARDGNDVTVMIAHPEAPAG